MYPIKRYGVLGQVVFSHRLFLEAVLAAEWTIHAKSDFGGDYNKSRFFVKQERALFLKCRYDIDCHKLAKKYGGQSDFS